MTGIFGGVGFDDQRLQELAECHRRRWPGVRVETAPGAVVGGMAPGDLKPLYGRGGGWRLVDGELAAYHPPGETSYGPAEAGSKVGDDRGVPTVPGVLADVDARVPSVRLAADWSGGFPVIWHRGESGFAFSSQAGALAEVFNLKVDPVGVVGFVKDGYYPGPKTCFTGASRVQPGQIVEYDGRLRRLTIRETSRAWTGPPDERDSGAVAEALWSQLVKAVDGALPADASCGLLISAGWDSRTLLAATLAVRDRSSVAGLSHGDTASRELGIAAHLCKDAGVPCSLRMIRPEEFEPGYVRSTYRSCGTAQFPYWRSSARAFADTGTSCVSSGVFGEVLGGHYGLGMAMSGWRRARWIVRRLLPVLAARPIEGPPGNCGSERIAELLVRGVTSVSRFFAADFWGGYENLPERLEGAVVDEFDRLRRRGVTDPSRLAEAYLTEHRGAQYIAAQMRTARAEGPVAMPFGHRRLLSYASRVPIESKIQNRLNRLMLGKASPRLLERPLAAVLVPASAPLVLQEASRVARKAWEKARWSAHSVSGGRVSRPHLSWIDFSALAGSDHPIALARDLWWDGWNKVAILRMAEAVATGSWQGSLHKPVLQLLKLYTLDLDLRRGG